MTFQPDGGLFSLNIWLTLDLTSISTLPSYMKGYPEVNLKFFKILPWTVF
jgi:hypothetical protein